MTISGCLIYRWSFLLYLNIGSVLELLILKKVQNALVNVPNERLELEL